MKKQLCAIAGGAAVIGGAAVYGISDMLFKSLITRSFTVPKAVSRFITEKEDGIHDQRDQSPNDRGHSHRQPLF